MNKGHRRDLAKNLPYKPGCYIIRNGSQVLYVGQSVNVKQRWLSHTHKNFIERNFPGVTIEVVLCEEKELTLKENQLIKNLQPILNDIGEIEFCKRYGIPADWWATK
jgi:excinuclease UvrABC nuclease subunit